ncbi:MAG: dTDP-glucose 4,6-dehydratase [Desulfitobacteriia bacterium]|jgi:dTDP-glucose 4,6-dehydratase
MKVIMVTGGAGFVGSNFVRYILSNHPDFIVINYDNLSLEGALENIRDLEGRARYYFVPGDINDAKKVKKVLSECNPDYVINFAAAPLNKRNTEPLLVGRTNILGVLNLLTCLKDYWQAGEYKHKRFIQVCAAGETTSGGDNLYAAAQDSAVLLGKAFFKTYKFPIIITRSCPNYGPYQPQEEFIPQAIIKALRQEAIPVYGEATNPQEWMYVLDHASALMRILLEGQPGEVYSFNSGEYISNLELVKIILSNAGQNPAAQDSEALDQDKSPAPLNLEENNLTWQGSYSLREGIKKTIEWYRRRI